VLIAKDGTPYRIDNGGSLRFRAQADARQTSNGTATFELWTMRDAAIGKQAADTFSGLQWGRCYSTDSEALARCTGQGEAATELRSTSG
jgi:hypothetical protein